MQTFKQIPFQNYIELKFTSKNLQELAQQQALIKYKRNAQLLAQIFTFDPKKRDMYKNQDTITQAQLEQVRNQLKQEQQLNAKTIQEAKQTAKRYQQINNNIKQIRNKQQLKKIIEQLKKNNMYDDCHPFFVQKSPFYLSNTDQEYLEVARYDQMSQQGLTFFQIN